MPTIAAIDKNTVRQICVSQVVTTVGGAVKELVENAIDAGASEVVVKTVNWGIDEISAEDNGKGIPEDDFHNIVAQHATSKIGSFSDVETGVDTFGFRGEALSALCGLADLSIQTRHVSAPRGTLLRYSHDQRIKERSEVVGCKQGTVITVRSLFTTLAVRRKELERSGQKEYHAAIRIVQEYCVASSGVKIRLMNKPSSKSAWSVLVQCSGKSIIESVHEVFGLDTVNALQKVNIKLPTGMTISGFVSRTTKGCGRVKTDARFLYIRGRPVDVPAFGSKLNAAYKRFNVKQKPMFFLNIAGDAKDFDVNVTPDKRTVLVKGVTALCEHVHDAFRQFWESTDPHVQASTPLGSLKSVTWSDSGDSEADQFILKQAEAPSVRKTAEPAASVDAFLRLRTLSKVASDNKTDDSANADSGEGPPVDGEGILVPPPHDADSNTEGDLPGTRQRGALVQPIEDDPSEPSPSLDSYSRKLAVASSTVQHPQRNQQEHPSTQQEHPSTPDKFVSSALNATKQTSTVPVGIVGSKEAAAPSAPMQTLAAPIGIEGSEEASAPGAPMHTLAAPIGIGGSEEAAAPSATKEGVQYTDEPRKEIQRAVNLARPESNDPFKSMMATILANKPANRKPARPPTDTLLPTIQASPSAEVLDEIDEDENPDSDASSAGRKKKRKAAGAAADRMARKKKKQNSKLPAPSSPEDEAIDWEELNRELLAMRNEGSELCFDTKASVPDQRADVFLDSFDLDGVDASLQGFTAAQRSGYTAPDVNWSWYASRGAACEDELASRISKEDFKHMRIVGQFNKGFIVAALRDELFLIDQHASDEKYNYERLKAAHQVKSQPLVQPRTLCIPAGDALLLRDNEAVFTQNGFRFRFDDTCADPQKRVQVTAVPTSYNTTYTDHDIQEVLAILKEIPGAKAVRPTRTNAMLASRACRSSYMIGHTLSARVMACIVRHMASMNNPWNCPHGRPTLRHLATITHAPLVDSAYQMTTQAPTPSPDS
ncbi:DNA mismatch repair protein PMS1 [Diplonema papillatum]|nr:DNA mismatch repair protein PMS1 [Diplonema papillatum]